MLAPLAVCFGFFGIGWNGVQHTLMAELVGPRSAGTAIGLGLAISSFGVTICPPLFGLAAERYLQAIELAQEHGWAEEPVAAAGASEFAHFK